MKYTDGLEVKLNDYVIHKLRIITPQGKIIQIQRDNKVKVLLDLGFTVIEDIANFKKDTSSVEIGKKPKNW